MKSRLLTLSLISMSFIFAENSMAMRGEYGVQIELLPPDNSLMVDLDEVGFRQKYGLTKSLEDFMKGRGSRTRACSRIIDGKGDFSDLASQLPFSLVERAQSERPTFDEPYTVTLLSYSPVAEEDLGEFVHFLESGLPQIFTPINFELDEIRNQGGVFYEYVSAPRNEDEFTKLNARINDLVGQFKGGKYKNQFYPQLYRNLLGTDAPELMFHLQHEMLDIDSDKKYLDSYSEEYDEMIQNQRKAYEASLFLLKALMEYRQFPLTKFRIKTQIFTRHVAHIG